MRLIVFISVFMLFQKSSFKESQLKNDRVKKAYEDKEQIVKGYFREKNISFDGFRLFIRGFKREGKLEAWVQEKGRNDFKLLVTYDFCSTSGTLGPKRKEGDLQIPEGVYHVNHFNPLSNFYLSLGVSYPNASDKILSDPKHPGGAIYIHGNCVTVGCIPITDDKIKELYMLAVEAKSGGQKEIPIHLFPSRLDSKGLDQLRQEFSASPSTIRFWENLQPIYQDFEKTKTLTRIRVNKKGGYEFTQ